VSSGYVACSCRDCFEIAISSEGDDKLPMCHACVEAGCEPHPHECEACLLDRSHGPGDPPLVECQCAGDDGDGFSDAPSAAECNLDEQADNASNEDL
jgi:hypothetical protein